MKHRNEVLVGSAVLLGIVFIVGGTIWLRGAGLGRDDTEIKARFAEVGQLLKGNAVKLRGVPIGRVERIDLDSLGNGVIITMRIDGKLTLPEDPVVLLSPESMFGDWQAEIVPRSSFPRYNYSEAGDPAILPGYSLPDISRLTAVADQIAQNMAILSERVSITFTEETALKLRRSVDNVLLASEKAMALVDRQSANVDRISRDFQQATQAASDAAAAVSRTLTQVELAVGEGRLVQIVQNMEATSSRAAALADTLLSMSRDMRVASATADSTMRRVGAIASAIQRGEGSLGRLMVDTMLYVSIRESNLELQRLLRDIRENPRKYITVRVF
jgi:phospholipid/cholesterol/gamma-HCH transport system substrate-binding protein